ncbi:MAG: hypothetical protein LQ337_003508 [Flavoplaca oasis]|nr:MAG: hypothetical protein LQ337_003508 [Flavoplaca oasis]
MSAAKSRKPFAYAEEEEIDTELPEHLDEEEQEKLIAQMKQQDEERTMMFKVINPFQCVTFISSDKMQRAFLAIPLISAVAFLPPLLSASSTQRKFIALLSISSLLCTAYLLFFLPESEATGKRMNTRGPPGPLLQHGPYLNGVLSFMIGLSALTMDDKRMDHDGFWLLCLLPVDIESLERLKYPYKGA